VDYPENSMWNEWWHEKGAFSEIRVEEWMAPAKGHSNTVLKEFL
jgi:hypothetical protein